MNTIDDMRQRLTVLLPQSIEILDDSARQGRYLRCPLRVSSRHDDEGDGGAIGHVEDDVIMLLVLGLFEVARIAKEFLAIAAEAERARHAKMQQQATARFGPIQRQPDVLAAPAGQPAGGARRRDPRGKAGQRGGRGSAGRQRSPKRHWGSHRRPPEERQDRRVPRGLRRRRLHRDRPPALDRTRARPAQDEAFRLRLDRALLHRDLGARRVRRGRHPPRVGEAGGVVRG